MCQRIPHVADNIIVFEYVAGHSLIAGEAGHVKLNAVVRAVVHIAAVPGSKC